MKDDFAAEAGFYLKPQSQTFCNRELKSDPPAERLERSLNQTNKALKL
jgi:hypothetical protein